MSTIDPGTPAAIHPRATLPAPREIRVYSHSMILYWWPVWVVGYIMAALTYSAGTRAAIVPGNALWNENLHAIVLPDKASRPGIDDPGLKNGEIGEREAESKNLGVIFTVVVLLVVFITNTPLRGLWSAVAVLVVLVVTLVLAYFHKWGAILGFFGRISIHMNMGFYMFFSTLLFLLWLAVVFGFDRMHYWVFRPNQIVHEYVFGGGQTTYGTQNSNFVKRLDDPFRHILLGLGTGDLVISVQGPEHKETHQIANVAHLTQAKIRRLEAMVSELPDQ